MHNAEMSVPISNISVLTVRPAIAHRRGLQGKVTVTEITCDDALGISAFPAFEQVTIIFFQYTERNPR